MPQLPEQEDEEEEGGGISLWEGGVGGDGSGYTGPFEESERYLLNFSCPKNEGTYARLHVRTPKQGTTAPSTIDYDARKFQGAFFFFVRRTPKRGVKCVLLRGIIVNRTYGIHKTYIFNTFY